MSEIKIPTQPEQPNPHAPADPAKKAEDEKAFHPEKHREHHTVIHPVSTGVTHLDPGAIHI